MTVSVITGYCDQELHKYYINPPCCSMSAKNWVFTINNPTGDEFDEPNELISFIVYQREIGEEGTMHYQGYLELARKQRLSWLKSKVSATAHWEIRRGSQQQAVDYCTKEETRVPGPGNGPFFHGERSVIRAQGERSDIRAVYSAIREGAPNSQLWAEFPEFMTRYSRAADEFRREYQQQQQRLTTTGLIPRQGWQQTLWDDLQGVPHPRQVIWIYETEGNVGKSYFAHSYDVENSFLVSGGRHEDIMYAFSMQTKIKVVFFDYGRDQEDQFPYRLLEKLKDGCYLSSKYKSMMMRFDIPHVVVMANFAPNTTRLSNDRWDIRHISNFILSL